MIPDNETDELLRKLEPVIGKKAKSLWLLDQLDDEKNSVISKAGLIKLLANRHANVDFREEIKLPPPSPDVTPGTYHLGTIIYPDKPYSTIGLTEEDLLRHVLIVGMTGTGKTNLALHLLSQLAKRKIRFWVFDWKRNYRRLKQLPELRNMKVFRIGDKDCEFRFNPLIPPPGMDPRHWMAMFIDVCKHAFFLGHGVEYFLRKAIDELYGRFGVYEGSKRYPTFVDLEKVLVKEYVKGREMLWMSSAKRAVASLTFKGILRDVLNVHENADLSKLTKENIIFEMDNLASLERTFMAEALLLWLYHYKKSLGRAEKLNGVILIEEAHHILSGRKERSDGEETIVESSLRMIREFGEGVIIVDQEPSKLSQSAIANTSTKVCFNLGSFNDVKVMSGAMNLKSGEERYIDKLPIGSCITKLKNRFSEPVLVRVPHIRMKNVEKW